MEKAYKIGKSKIEGEGLIAIKDLVAGDLVGMSHSGGQPSSEIGQYYNHSDSPNAVSELVGDDRYVIVSSPIKKGEEIVLDYREQPELEQPEDFKKAQNGYEIPRRVGTMKNEDGSESTHRMKTEVLDDGTWVSFPMLFQNEDGTWVDDYVGTDVGYTDSWDKFPGYLEAKKRGEVIVFGGDKDAALAFGEGNWKDIYNANVDVDNWNKEYVQSDNYRSMLERAKEKPSVINSRIDAALSFDPYTNITYDPNNYSLGQYYNTGRSSSDGNMYPMQTFPYGEDMLNYNPMLMENHPAYFNEGVATGGWPALAGHELAGHYGVDKLNRKQRKALKSMINWPALDNFAGDNDDTYNHGKDVYEMRANLTQLRYQLAKAGIYNSSEGLAATEDGEEGDNPFTMEHLKQILEFNDDDSFKQIKPEFNNEILQFVAPEDIIWMMNNIASNDEVGDDLPEGTMRAKHGGSLPKAQDGKEVKDYFTSYLNSDLFKRRAIDLHGEENWEKIRDGKLKRLGDTEVDFSGEEEWADIYATDYSKENLLAVLGLKEKFDRLQSRYMRPGYDGNINPIVKVNPGQAVTMAEDHELSYNPFNSILANEYSHALGANHPNTNDTDAMDFLMTERERDMTREKGRDFLWADNNLQIPHDTKSYEIKSDIDTTRYELWKAGLYDFEEDFMFDQSHIDYIRENPDKFIKDAQLLEQFDDNQVVDMMNTFTDNSSMPVGMSKYGGSLPKAQRGRFFPKKRSKFTIDTPPTNIIGSGLFGNKGRWGVGFGQNSLNDVNFFHNQWYTHPEYESGINTINQWNRHEQNQRLAGFNSANGWNMFNDPDMPIVHKSALWKDDAGNIQYDLTGVDPLASKFSFDQWNTGIIPEGYVFKKDFTDASGQNMHELYPVTMLEKGVNRTKQNADNLKIHGFFDELKHNWRNRPSVSNILSSPYIPTWKKPFRAIGSYTNPFTQYIKDSSLSGGHASSFGSGTQYIDDNKVSLKNLRNDIAPKFRLDDKGFNNMGIDWTGYQGLNNNPLFSLTDDVGSVVVHERGHQMDNTGSLWPEKYNKDFELAIDPNFQTTMGRIGEKLGLNAGTANINVFNMKPYFSEPTEQYARMMQERHRLGLTPADEYTLDMFNENPNMFGMGKYLLKDENGVPLQFIKNMNKMKEEGGELPTAQFGKGLKLKTPKLNIKPITRFTDALSRYNYNRSKDIFGNTGLSLSGSSVPYINRAASINSFRGLQNVGDYDPETIALMGEYTVDSAPFKLTDQELANSPWQMSTMKDEFGNPIYDADGWSKLALSNKIQGNQIGFKNTSFERQPLSLTRNWNEGQSLVGESGNIGDLRAALNSGNPIQLGDITSWSAGEHGLSQFGTNRYVIKDFNLDTPALLNEYKGLTNNQAKVWKEREILLDNPKFQVTNIIDKAPRLPHWSIETSPNTTFTRTDYKGDAGSSVWDIGKDFTLSGKPIVTKWNPFARIMPNGQRNPWYESMYEASILDPKFRVRSVPQYGKDIELQIVKKKGGETKKKSKYQSSPFTKGKQTLTDPSKLLNTMIKQGIFTAKFKMGGEQSLGNGFTAKKEFDGAKNIPYVTYMSSPDIEGRIYYDSDSGEGMNDFNIIDIESELLKRQRKHRRTKDIILKYRNGEELTHTERSHLNSLGLLD